MPIDHRASDEPVRPRQFLPLSLARTIWKNWGWTVSVWGVIGFLACGFVYRLPAVYKAETLILVESQKIPEKLVSSTVNAELQDRIATISQEVLSATRLQTVMEKFDLYRDQRRNHVQEEIIDMMRKDMNIKLERGWTRNQPGAFRVTYQGSSPETVAAVVNQIGNFFIEENLKAREEQAAGTSEFLKAQVEEAKKSLEEQERKLSEYKLQHQGELPQQENSLLAMLANLNVQLQGNQDAITRAGSNKANLEDALSTAEESLTALMSANRRTDASQASQGSLVIASAGKRTKESDVLRAKVDALRARYTESHPDVREARLLLDRALQEEDLESVKELQVAPQHRELPVDRSQRASSGVEFAPEIRSQQERVASLRHQAAEAAKAVADRQSENRKILADIASVRSRFEKLPLREQEMAGVLRDYQISKENYEQLLSKNLSAEMATDMEKRQKAEKFTVLDVARTPEKPFKPNRSAFYTAGIMASFLLGVSAAFVRELKRNVVLGEWELPRDLTILGRVKNIQAAADEQYTFTEST